MKLGIVGSGMIVRDLLSFIHEIKDKNSFIFQEHKEVKNS